LKRKVEKKNQLMEISLLKPGALNLLKIMEKVINLVDMIDDLKGVDKVRLAIHLLEESYFSSKYDKRFIELLNEVLEKLDSNSKKVITNFAKYKNLFFISAKYMELSLLEKQKILDNYYLISFNMILKMKKSILKSMNN